jgi:2-oxoglutarate dehydrogenase E2 component (dihydrolipoamide succinyltransferase)
MGKGDLIRLLESGAGRAEKALGELAPVGPRERLVPMSPLRRTVARRLLEAQENAAILTTFNEADLSRVLELRDRFGPLFQEKHGVKLGFMSFFVKAAVEALLAFPVVNAEARGENVVYKDHYDIGVAVGGGKGLVVPVVRDADQLSFAQIELTIAELAKRARENRITMEDLSGGTFTISNGGIYGSLLSTPILNPPQSAILGLHKIQKRPAVGPDDQVVVRPMMYLALSYDHRIIDGREAVSFLVRIKEILEDPSRLLLEV